MKRQKNKKRKNAFSLVELMAVLLIIGLLAGVAIKSFMGTTDKAKVTATQAKMQSLSDAVTMFKLDTGRYPDADIGLIELVEEPTDVEGWTPGGYLKTTEVPLDAWNYEFIYELNPESGKAFVIISYGADGEEGGEGYDADLYSTDAY
jgi:general secretion pathway protein G